MQVVSQQSNYVTVCRQDFCANYIGQELWLDALDWERASEWRAAPPEVWEVDGERAGTVQAAEPLTYVKLDGAGHMVSALLVTVKCMVLRAAAGWLRWSQLILARNAEHCKARRGHMLYAAVPDRQRQRVLYTDICTLRPKRPAAAGLRHRKHICAGAHGSAEACARHDHALHAQRGLRRPGIDFFAHSTGACHIMRQYAVFVQLCPLRGR